MAFSVALGYAGVFAVCFRVACVVSVVFPGGVLRLVYCDLASA